MMQGMNKACDEILIQGLELPVCIGVPEEERAQWQVLRGDVRLGLKRGFDAMRDDLAETVDYDALTREIKALAAARPRQLLETLAAELVALCLGKEGMTWAEVTLHKRILPGTDAVAVRMHRTKGD